MPDTLAPDQQPTPVNSPASGTYGEKAALDGLKKSLPQAQPSTGPTASPLPPVKPEPITPLQPQPGRPQGAGPVPPGISPALLGPTQRPNVPVGTPLVPQAPAVAPSLTAAAQRIATLQLLAQSPDVSDQTREWAQMVLQALVG